MECNECGCLVSPSVTAPYVDAALKERDRAVAAESELEKQRALTATLLAALKRQIAGDALMPENQTHQDGCGCVFHEAAAAIAQAEIL